MATFPSVPVPSRNFVSSSNRKVAVTRYLNGTEQRIARSTQQSKSFAVEYQFVTEAEAKIITDFFASMKGKVESFNFVDPVSGLTFVVRFDSDTVAVKYISVDVQNLAVKLVQVFNETPAP